jgi:hypothetical protein
MARPRSFGFAITGVGRWPLLLQLWADAKSCILTVGSHRRRIRPSLEVGSPQPPRSHLSASAWAKPALLSVLGGASKAVPFPKPFTR